MKIEKAITQSQLEINRKINPNIAISYINEIQMRLAINFETARTKETVTIKSDDTTKYHSLSDYVSEPLKVENVKYSGQPTRFKNYEVEDKKIIFQENGTYDVKIQKMPELNSLKTEEMKLPSEYHFAISKWISFKELQKLYGSDDNNVAVKEEEFWTMVSEAHKNIRRLNKKPKKIKAPRW